MSSDALLSIDGCVGRPARLTRADLAALDERYQVRDVSRLDASRRGDAVALAGLLELVSPRSEAQWLTLHASHDDFHVSIPLAAVRELGLLIYQLDGQELPITVGGPLRFLIPQVAACHTAEMDECANVKFVDRIELSAARGVDNRPQDPSQHASLHKKQSSPPGSSS